jgi:hypothetical protein
MIGKELETLLAIQAGQTVLIAALIKTHPEPLQAQLAAVSLLESFLNGAGGQALAPHQHQQARDYVDALLVHQPQRYEEPLKRHQL